MKAKTVAVQHGREVTTSGGSIGLLVTLFIVLLVLVGLMIRGFTEVAEQDRNDKQRLGLLAEQQLVSQQLVKHSLAAIKGEQNAFDSIKSGRDRFDQTLTQLRRGNLKTGLAPISSDFANNIKGIELPWTKLRDHLNTIYDNRDAIKKVREASVHVSDMMPELMEATEKVITALRAAGGSSLQAYMATRQMMLIQRIESNVGRIMAGGFRAATAADRFSRDTVLFRQVLEGMLNGDQELKLRAIRSKSVRDPITSLLNRFNEVGNQIELILINAPEMFRVHNASTELSAFSDQILIEANQLQERIVGMAAGRVTFLGLSPIASSYTFAILAFIVLLSMALLVNRDIRRQKEQEQKQRRLAEEQNQRNQIAIQRLLDEMVNLADGDLTVNATVTEDITGAIADSVNFAIDEMRRLVMAINATSSQVGHSALDTQQSTRHLAEASERQAQQINSASTAIHEMAESFDKVSKDAGRSAEVAQGSKLTATSGADVVRKTIESMDNIRERIQETSKRIKRLGESSQEIGDIVELIKDIADQTNILALNAAIQAAMAGDAGRGFAVVADEVQHLAERSSNATKQIEALVKTIQSDTSEAILSMEESTTGVVAGAKLAEDAGEALSEIETVSTQVAERVQGIADMASKQATLAAGMTETMNTIQDITSQTTEGTIQAADSIGRLSTLTDDLNRSVAGFKLPAQN